MGWMSDDRGVNAVIGIILMVAIVVILASVAAVYVLQFGDAGVEDSPRVAITHNYDERMGANGQYLNLTVEAGDRIETEQLHFAATGAVGTGSSGDVSITGDPLATQANTALRAGDEITIGSEQFDTSAGENVDLSDATIRLIWEPPTDGEPEQAQTIWQWEA